MKAVIALFFLSAALYAGPLDKPAYNNSKGTPMAPNASPSPATATPKPPPFVPRTSTLSQPDRMRSAADPGPMTGNPLERGAIRDPKTITGTVMQSVPGALLLSQGLSQAPSQAPSQATSGILIKGLPLDYTVQPGTRLKVKINPEMTTGEYPTGFGTTVTMEAYIAVEIPKPLR
jgi:hypothetical protein